MMAQNISSPVAPASSALTPNSPVQQMKDKAETPDSTAKAFALTLCREVYYLNKGDARWWRTTYPIEYKLGMTPENAAAAWKYAEAARWIETIGDPINSVRLTEAGRRILSDII
jgi:hypothetical protein